MFVLEIQDEEQIKECKKLRGTHLELTKTKHSLDHVA